MIEEVQLVFCAPPLLVGKSRWIELIKDFDYVIDYHQEKAKCVIYIYIYIYITHLAFSW